MKIPLYRLDLQDKKKLALLVIAALFVVYADFSFILAWQISSLKNTNKRIIRLKKDIAVVSAEISKMRGLRQAGTGLSPQAKKIVSSGDIPLLLRDIANMAEENNIKVLQIRPLDEPKSKAGQELKTPFTVLDISLELAGSYHALGGFINHMEDAGQFIAVEEFKITRRESDYLRQTVSLLLRTYVRK